MRSSDRSGPSQYGRLFWRQTPSASSDLSIYRARRRQLRSFCGRLKSRRSFLYERKTVCLSRREPSPSRSRRNGLPNLVAGFRERMVHPAASPFFVASSVSPRLRGDWSSLARWERLEDETNGEVLGHGSPTGFGAQQEGCRRGSG